MEFNNIFILHTNILFYALFRFYMSFENLDKKSFIDNNIIFNNKEYFNFLIKTKIKKTFDEQIILRLLLVQLMYLFMNEEYIYPIWCIIFSLYYFYNEFNIYIKIGKYIYSFIISYLVLFNAPFLLSLLVHIYSELCILMIIKFLSNNYNDKLKLKD